jgi:hypothetical protein
MVAISRLHISDVSESKAGGRSGLCEGTKLMRAAAEEAKLLLKNEEKLTDKVIIHVLKQGIEIAYWPI